MNYPDLSHVRTILVAALRHHGDVLLSSPLFSCLKQALPQAEIDAYIYKETLPMVEGHWAINDYILCDKQWKKEGVVKKFFHEAGLLRKIKRGKYDLVINLTEGDRGAIAAKASSAKLCVGFDPKGSGMKGKAKVYTHLVKHGHHPRHTVEKHLDALRVLGLFPQPEQREPFFHIPDRAAVSMKPYEGYVVVHPVSRWMFKCWPAKKMAEVIGELQARGEKVVLTASSDREEIAMIRAIQEVVEVEDVAGTISLKELGAIIRGAKMLVTVDSVPLHLASVFKTPVVVLFGPTSEETWGPWRHPNAKVVAEQMSCRPCYKPGCGSCGVSDCLETLSVESVTRAIQQVMSRVETLV